MNILVTGSSSGLGYALTEYYRAKGDVVYGLSRRTPENVSAYYFQPCDLSELERIRSCVASLLEGCERLDVVYLNAGTLGRIQDMSECSVESLKEQMDVNLWANKVILDTLIELEIDVKQIIAISSGASQSGSLGWNGYSLSKAALNMLVKLYAEEMGETHLVALAPGLVETPMLGSILYGDHDTQRYRTVERLRGSKEEGLVLSPEATAALIDTHRGALQEYESGAYVDIRDLKD